MSHRLLILLIAFFGCTSLSLGRNSKLLDQQIFTDKEELNAPLFFFSEESPDSTASDTSFVPKKRKLKAVLLSVLLGHFGVHRIYLGTKANVPVAYSLTLGGGLGLLPLIDAVMILRSEDLEEYSNNDQVIMWSKPKRK